MAKKPTVKKAATKKVIAPVEMETNPDLEHLEGLDNYFKCKNKKELTVFVENAISKINSLENVNENRLQKIETSENEFYALSDKDKDFNACLLEAGIIISELNDLLIKNS